MTINRKDKDWKKRRESLRRDDYSPLMYGKIPPQAPDLEEAVLGAILLERDKQVEVMAILPNAESFYIDAHQKIYSVVQDMSTANRTIDLLTVTEELRKRDELEIVGGAYFLTKLTMGVVTSANAEDHARIIQEKYMLRQLITIGGMMIQNSYENSTDVFDLLDVTESKLFELSSGNIQNPYVSQFQIGENVRNRMKERMASTNKLLGVDTGYAPLNRITYGWRPANVIIVAARPSVGKTAFVINLLLKSALKGVGAGFFSLEMPEPEITDRMTAAISHVHLDDIMRGNLAEWQQKEVLYAADVIQSITFMVDDTPGLNIYDLRSKARRMVHVHGVKIIAIDYLQLMSSIDNGNANNREQEIAKICRDLKALSTELNIPIIALSQLNRSVESRGAKGEIRKPQLSDLRESGAIEQDAHLVLFLSRPDYQKSEDQVDPTMKDEATIHIAKNRNGKVDDIAMHFVKEIQAWMDLDEYKQFKEDNIFGDPRAKAVDNARAGIPSSLPNNEGYHFSQTIPDEFWENDK